MSTTTASGPFDITLEKLSEDPTDRRRWRWHVTDRDSGIVQSIGVARDQRTAHGDAHDLTRHLISGYRELRTEPIATPKTQR